MSELPYTLVIPTYQLAHELDRTLASVASQRRQPRLTIVVDSSADDESRSVASSWTDQMPVHYLRVEERSAARQRNAGAQLVEAGDSPLVAFVDDDMTLHPETCAQLCAVFESDPLQQVGGVAARIDEIQRPAPSGWSWWYYRLQAGYADHTYGGRLFGPAINCLPCYTETQGDLIPAEWLNSGCVFYRSAVFRRELFPQFEGYSFMEDVHLSARIARTHRLYFHTRARCNHRDGAASRGQRDGATLARMRIRNQRIVAREVLGVRGLQLELKLLLHRLFASISILRGRAPGWRYELMGTWT